MKIKWYLVSGLTLFALALGGCGGKADQGQEEAAAKEETAAITDAKTSEAEGSLVEMEKPTPTTTPAAPVEEIQNEMGTKTQTASQVVLINQTGSEIADIFIRPALPAGEDSDEWGEEQTGHRFVLGNGDKAVYYYDGSLKGDDGQVVTSYDIRVSYSDVDRNECFFRRLPLTVMKELRLCMDGTGEDSIPYARYLTSTSSREYSTLEEVKKRLGLLESDSQEDTEPTPAPTTAPGTPTPTPSVTPDQNENADGGGEDADDVRIKQAETFIGQSLSSLENALGSAESSEYVDEPETGMTGYHYYGSFTVSTFMDGDEEVVGGIW